MTGGRRRDAAAYEAPWWPRPGIEAAGGVASAATADDLAIQSALDGYKRAMRFRRRLNRALRVLEISFAEWRVLEVTSRLISRTGDAVSHLEVSRELDLGEGSVSRLMWNLSRRDLVSHDLDAWGLCLRVFMTEQSERLVAEARELAARHASRTA